MLKRNCRTCEVHDTLEEWNTQAFMPCRLNVTINYIDIETKKHTSKRKDTLPLIKLKKWTSTIKKSKDSVLGPILHLFIFIFFFKLCHLFTSEIHWLLFLHFLIMKTKLKNAWWASFFLFPFSSCLILLLLWDLELEKWIEKRKVGTKVFETCILLQRKGHITDARRKWQLNILFPPKVLTTSFMSLNLQ